MTMNNDNCDVLIIGASMAGSCLARQLKIKHPELAITVVDRKSGFDYWVGESMLEIFWDYATTDLQLGPYLDANFLYKHGLRFFFDSADKNLKLSQMSEIGRAWYDSVPAHQIDRKRFDEDMCRFNIESGIDVRMNCHVKDVEIDALRGHRAITSDGEIRCRWLVDAAGFNAPVGRKLGLIKPIETHPISARWARVRNTRNLDLLGDDVWRERVNYISRFLSTNHFLYDGYWFWVIPLDEHTCSIGVVWRHDKASLSIKGQQEFLDFVLSHACLAEFLGDAYEVLDYHGLKNMSRVADQFYSRDRWFLTGMSAAFLDPLFSSGSAFLSDANRMIGDLIATDMAGDQQAFKNKITAYNAHSRWWLDNFMLHISGNYHGSYDLLRQLFQPLLMDYFGIIFPASASKFWGYDPDIDYGDGSALRAEKAQMLEHSVNHRAHAMKAELEEFLKEREGLYVNNNGKFFDINVDSWYVKHTRSRGKTLTPMEIQKIQRAILEVSARLALNRMAASLDKIVNLEALEVAVQSVVDQSLTLREGLALLFELQMPKEASLPKQEFHAA